MKKERFIIEILIFVVIVVGCLLLMKAAFVYDNSVYVKKESELKKQIDSLNNVVLLEIEAKNVYQSKIDSLKNVKKKIKYVYVYKSKKVDTATVNTLVREFKSIFAKDNIK